MADIPASSSLGAHGARPPTVLVVDDDEGVTTFFATLLARNGYVVDVAHDGPSALTSALNTPPDVVLLDVMIPGLDGFEICRRLKREPGTRLTPIILVTALSAREQRIEGLEAGADEFLTKPVDTHERYCQVEAAAGSVGR